MSVVTTFYPRTGIPVTVTPPGPGGIYFTSVVVYNPLTTTFTVQNGVNQNILAAQTAQLFSVPTAGGTMTIAPLPSLYPYGTWLGPITTVWFEAGETPGSYPVTLGPLAGLVLWTPQVHLIGTGIMPLFFAPGTVPAAIVIDNLSAATGLVSYTGQPSGAGTAGIVPANGQVTIVTDPIAGDTYYVLEPETAADYTIQLSVLMGGPQVTAPPTPGGTVTLVNTKYTQDNYVIVGPIVLPTDPANTIGPFYVHIGAGQSTSYTGVFASTLSGSVVGTIQHNGADVPGLVGITITDVGTAFAPSAEIIVADHDSFQFVPTDVSGAPVTLTIEFDRTDAS